MELVEEEEEQFSDHYFEKQVHQAMGVARTTAIIIVSS